MQNSKQNFLNELDDRLLKAADKLATSKGAKMPASYKGAIMGCQFAFKEEVAIHLSTKVKESNKIAKKYILENRAQTETRDVLSSCSFQESLIFRCSEVS